MHSEHTLVWKDAVSRKIRIAMPMCVFMAAYLGIFLLIENWNRLHYTVIHMAADDVIPFCEVLSGSNISHIIGEDTLGCVLDEANVRKALSGSGMLNCSCE